MAGVAAAPARAATPACAPVLEGGWIRAAPPGATAMAGYGILRNACRLPVGVRDVRAPDFAMAMIHRTTVENGMSRMRPARDLVVPAGGAITFAPGGTHMMLMHPRQAIREGDRLRVEVVLTDGRRVPAMLDVRRDAPPQR